METNSTRLVQAQRKLSSREKNIQEERALVARPACADGTFQKGSVKTSSRKTEKCILALRDMCAW